MEVPGVWGEEFLVNAMTSGAQMSPVITALVGGRFAIAYTDYSHASFDGFTDFSESAVRVQVFNSDGSQYSSAVQVNTVTSYTQDSPSITALADGGFVVSYSDSSAGWDSWGDDSWYEAVRMQRFHDDASTNGTESLVNTTVFRAQDYSSVALLENGQFIVAWSDGISGVEMDLNAQLYNADGSVAGDEFQLNAEKSGVQADGIVTGLEGGGYVVTWVDATGVDGDLGTIMARMFETDGTPLGSEFQVNTTATGDQYEPCVTALAGGGFFIAWTDNSRGVDTGGDDASHFAIRGQLFDASGSAVGSEFRVNQVTTYGQSQPAVLALADGRFIVAFSDTSSGLETNGDDAEFGAIRARVFHADGSPDGDEFLVNVTTVSHQNEPQMAQLADGRVVFTWTDYSAGVATNGDDTSNGAVRARILDLRETAINLVGTDGYDDFTGTSWNDTLSGGEGNDSLSGGNGDDKLIGGDGDDTISGGTGADFIKGNNGPDTLSGNDGDDYLLGGNGDDSIHGDDGDDIVKGANGKDTIYGGIGDDEIVGGGGDDILFGDNGRDNIVGGNGQDQITGGKGGDVLSGGGNADTFIFTNLKDSLSRSSKRDVITDFEDGKDHIDLSAIDGNPATDRNDPLRFIGLDNFTGTSGEIRYKQKDAYTMIQIDLDGDKSIDMKIELTDWHLLKVGDFIL